MAKMFKLKNHKSQHDAVVAMKLISIELASLANLKSGPETGAILRANAAIEKFISKLGERWFSYEELDLFFRRKSSMDIQKQIITSQAVVKRLKELSTELMNLANCNTGPEMDAILEAEIALTEYLNKQQNPRLCSQELGT